MNALRTCFFLVAGMTIPGAAAVASAQDGDPPAPAPRCTPCKSIGREPCPEHKSRDCELEGDLYYCSFMAGCAVCEGTGWVDCTKCVNEAAEAELVDRRIRIQTSTPGMEWMDEQMGRTLRKGTSEHFKLVWEVDTLKVGRKRLSDHELLHLYAQRLEELYDAYTETLHVQDQEFSQKTMVLVWYFPKDQIDGSLRFCENSSPLGVKLLGINPRFSVCASKQYFKDDESLHRYIVHNVTHLLFSNQSPQYWIGQLRGGAWPDEGLGHWMELHFFDRADTYCYQEQNTMRDFKGGNYKPAVRKMVAMDKAPPIAEVFTRVTNTLTPPEHAAAFSYVDYLIHVDAKKFSAMGRLLRSKVPSREALKRVYGLGPLQLETAWKEWVLETYPAR